MVAPTSRRWLAAEEAFSRLAGLPDTERERELDRLGVLDASLEREVRSLIGHSEGLEGFLEAPALGAGFAILPSRASRAPGADPDPMIGRSIDRYRIAGRIASGGMGTVYLASRADDQFEQRVAIKIVKRGMDTDEVLRRFRRERQTLATLEHPSVARLIDGGATEDGLPYLVMEYVEGTPIDAYCDERRLDVAQRLGLFLRVCEAVSHAHSRLVVHRDLKPSNIPVTAEGVPKLLDFGIATVLAPGAARSETRAHARWLTPEYASPEQAAGLPIATTSDVYSLGVLLCELLAGELPYAFSERTPAEIERVITQVEPCRPSLLVSTSPAGLAVAAARATTPRQLARRLRGDLDTIVMHALRKEPDRRYASVEMLAADVRRHLQHLPISARRETFLYSAGKLARRHALVTSLGLVSVLLLVGGLAAIARQARIAEERRADALAAQARSDAVTGFLQRMLESADPTVAGPSPSVRSLLDGAARRLDDGELSGQAPVEAALRRTLGRTYQALGLYAEAETQLRAALDRGDDRSGETPDSAALDLEQLASVLYANHRFDEAAALLGNALELHRLERPPDGAGLARALSSLGVVRRAEGDLDEAERLQREALEIRRRIGGADDLDIAESINNLAGVLRLRGQLDQAITLLDEALGIRRRRLGNAHPLVSQSVDNLAFALARKGDLAAAEPLYREALAIGLKVLGPEHPEVAVTQRNLAGLLAAEHRYDEAEEFLLRCVEIRARSFARDDVRTLMARLDLARVLLAEQRIDEADRLVEEAVAATDGLPPEAEARRLALSQAEEYHAARGLPRSASEARAPDASR